MMVEEPFEQPEPIGGRHSGLVVDIEGFEGPIDVLLTLARQQKVDLIHISILELADQYLAFIAEARRLQLEVAADYLVMAAWLAYLKSRLLLPGPAEDEQLSGPEMAEALAFKLRRLEAMQEAGANVMALPRLGVDIFPRGAPEGVEVIRTPVYQLSLYELLKAYGAQQRRVHAGTLEIAPSLLYSVDDALDRLSRFLGDMPDWQTLMKFLPDDLAPGMVHRSAVAATFAAALEMTRTGRLQIRQSGTFGPIYLRRKPDADDPNDAARNGKTAVETKHRGET
jgi:segregation and condensation protein A